MSLIDVKAMQVIKEKARTLGFTQVRLAREMGASLPTVKRWWAGQGVDLTVIDRLCGLLGLTLTELFTEVEGGTAKYTYTLEQEKVLATHPQTLAVFDLLVSGVKPAAIVRRYSLSEADLNGHLVRLDRAGLIEFGVGGRVRLLRVGEPQWNVGGPLSLRYRRPMIEALLGEHRKDEAIFYVHDYLEDDVVLLRAKLAELTRMMEAFNSRGLLKSDETKSYGVYLTLKPFEWDLRASLKRRG